MFHHQDQKPKATRVLACGVAVPDLWPGVGVVAPPRRVGVEAPLPPLLPCLVDNE